MATGIKETSEVIAVASALMTALEGALSDGHLDFGDIRFAAPLIGALNDAAKGLSLVPAEFADLDADEAKALLLKVVEVILQAQKVFVKVSAVNA